MKINKVILSCNNNTYYSDFWTPVSKIWKIKFDIDPILLVISNDKMDLSSDYGEVKYFNPLKNIPEHIQAQCIRYWYPSVELDTTWMISDIDMFPISKYYFIDSIKCVKDDKFVNLNSDGKYFPACYNCGLGRTFKDVIQIDENWEDFMTKVYMFKDNITYSHSLENSNISNLANWGLDEYYSCEMINKYNDQSKIINVSRPGGFCQRRLDRINWNPSEELIKDEWYNDCHSIRPYSLYKKQIDTLVNQIIGINLND